jgi:FkbM family methyltransferase
MSGKPLTIEDYERLNPHLEVEHAGCTVKYGTPNAVTVWRVQTIKEKEPITIEWIDSFESGAILVDVGANVGMYTMLAAVTRNARVYAFEPESQNFALLNKNIVMNDATDRVTAWPVALSDSAGLSELYVSGFRIGDSCHTFGEPVNFKLQRQPFAFAQGSVSATLDTLVESGTVASPDHIKIDVDGFEHKVVAGARQVLATGTVKSLLIEVNPALAEHQQLIADLSELGYTYDPTQVAAATRDAGTFEGVAEYLFFRR